MIRAVVVEDEEHSRRMLLVMLHEHCRQINVVAESDSVKNRVGCNCRTKATTCFS